MLYLSTRVDRAQDAKETLQPYLRRLAGVPLFESYHVSHHRQTTASASSAVSPSSPLVVLAPYAGREGLTEGLDWEAEQGKRAYDAVMGIGEGVRGFFENDAGEGEGEADEEGDEGFDM